MYVPVHTQRGVPTHHTVYPYVHTTVYIPLCICRYLYYLPMRVGIVLRGYYEGVPMRWCRCGFGLRLSRVAPPSRSPLPHLVVYEVCGGA